MFKRIHEVWMARTPLENDQFSYFFISWRRLQFARVPPYEIRVIFFQQNEIILRCKKCSAFFQNYNWENSSFSTRSYVHLQRYVQIHGKGGHTCPPPPKKNPKKPKNQAMLHGDQRYQQIFCQVDNQCVKNPKIHKHTTSKRIG